jgi:hypothetical protein
MRRIGWVGKPELSVVQKFAGSGETRSHLDIFGECGAAHCIDIFSENLTIYGIAANAMVADESKDFVDHLESPGMCLLG